jgi:hypothetical protein
LVFSDANGFDGTISLVGSTATLTITTALTTGSVPFIGASGALSQDNANLFFDDTNNRLGINTNAPTTALDVFGSGIIGRINGTSTNNAFLGFSSAGTNKWSIGNVQSDHRFRIYNEATTSELVSVLSTGEFGIGIANPTTKFHIDGAASALIANLDANVSVAKSISFRSDNSNRINLEVSGTESGSDAGADLFIRRYSDAGALIDTALYLKRSNGWFGIGYATPSSLFDIRDTSTTNTTSSLIIGSKYVASGGSDYAGTSGIEFKHYGSFLGAAWRNGGKIISTRLANYSENSLANSALDFYTTNLNTDALGMRLNNSGNLGLGVDLTTISLSYLLNVNASGIGGVAEVARFAARGNGGSNRGTGILIGAPGSSSIVNVARLVGYQNAASATADSAAFTIEVANTSGTLTERVRLNSIGQMSVGSTISNWDSTLRVIQIGEAGNFFSGFNGGSAIYAGSGAYYNAGWKYASASTGVNLIDVGDGNFLFRSAAAGTIGNAITWIDRFRVTSGGFTKSSNDGTFFGSTGTYHELRSNVADFATIMSNTASSPSGLFIQYVNASPNGVGNAFLYCRDSGLTVRAEIRSNGGLANFQANNVNLSDERTKKDIIPLESYWNKFKAIEIVKFKYIDQTHEDFNIGVIAQQVEKVAPEFIDIDGWNNILELDQKGNEIISEEEPLKSVYTSDLHHATIKVLQEAMEKIEVLEEKVKQLELK